MKITVKESTTYKVGTLYRLIGGSIVILTHTNPDNSCGTVTVLVPEDSQLPLGTAKSVRLHQLIPFNDSIILEV